MSHYEASTTVGVQCDIHLAELPFSPDTEVEIVVSPKSTGTPPSNGRLSTLLAALDQSHYAQPIGPLNRDDLHDRKHVH